MKKKQRLSPYQNIIILLIIVSVSMGFLGDDKLSTKTQIPKLYKVGAVNDEGGKKGDAYRLFVNNINLPLNSKGIIAAVNIEDPNPNITGSGGKFGQHGFLFSSGFYLSGFANGTLFANAVASASLVEDYVPGLAGTRGDSRAQLYVLKSSDPDFGTSWQDWKDAVDLGADFYDGDGDGVYSPSDKNGNNTWDPDEDRPDLLGDETVWTVYWDGVNAAQRRWNNVDPLGIEVRQTVFAYQSAGAIGNLVFVRYKFKYVGLGNSNEPDQLEDVYFGVWADPDLGEVSGFSDDLVGCDVPRNAGYTYNDGEDTDWGNNPPCFMIDYFSGPIDSIPGVTYNDVNQNNIFDAGDEPLDTAYSSRGLVLGRKVFPGAKNLPISSFVEYINGDQTLSDPDNREEARNLMLGKMKAGTDIDVCSFAYGNGATLSNCASIDPRFWYSGDPVTGTGWLNTVASDLRQMTNTGPFKLKKGEEKEIVVAYVVGQGENALNSVEIARDIDDGAQIIFNRNFLAPSPPPPPDVTVESNEEFIDLSWPTPEQINYHSISDAWDLRFGGYNIYAARSFNSSVTVDNEANFKLLGRYQADNYINNLYYKDGKTGGISLLYEAADSLNRLDTLLYKDPATGRMRFRITQDPFTGGKLTKGKPYYFIVTAYAVNFDALVNKFGGSLGDFGDYYLTDQTFVQAAENPLALSLFNTVLMGEDIYSPPTSLILANKVSGASDGNVTYDVIDQNLLKDNEYQVSFFKDEAASDYKMFWELKNVTTGQVLVDSGDYYLYDNPDVVSYPLTDGFITKVEEVIPSFGSPSYTPATSVWYDEFDDASATGVYYVGKDIPDGSVIFGFRNKQSDYISADRLRKVELRFGTSGKAYRYLHGFLGSTNLRKQSSYAYAEAVTSADTVGRGKVENWDTVNDRANGFIDVPFTAWVVDDKYPGDQRQLAVGIIERAQVLGGKTDGIWDPTDSLNLSGELIVIFDKQYDANGAQIEYTGGEFTTGSGTTTVWADILRSATGLQPIPVDAQGISQEQKDIFVSPWFNAMYVVGLQRKNSTSFYSNGDKLIVPVDTYPYTSEDVYRFSVNSNILTDQQSKDLFEKVNVFPNPLYGYNPYTANYSQSPDDPFVTFTNLPNEEITIKIYSLSGQLLRTLVKESNSTSPFLQWNLQNDAGLRVASGLYLAIVTSPKYGDKVLKFSIIMPQKQLQRY